MAAVVVSEAPVFLARLCNLECLDHGRTKVCFEDSFPLSTSIILSKAKKTLDTAWYQCRHRIYQREGKDSIRHPNTLNSGFSPHG